MSKEVVPILYSNLLYEINWVTTSRTHSILCISIIPSPPTEQRCTGRAFPVFFVLLNVLLFSSPLVHFPP